MLVQILSHELSAIIYCDVRGHARQAPMFISGVNCRGNAIYFFETSVLFETGELNAYVYDGGRLYRRKYVRTEGKGRTTTITLADGKLLPCIATWV